MSWIFDSIPPFRLATGFGQFTFRSNKWLALIAYHPFSNLIFFFPDLDLFGFLAYRVLVCSSSDSSTFHLTNLFYWCSSEMISENELWVKMPFLVVVFLFWEVCPIALEGRTFLFRPKLILALMVPSDLRFFENEVDKSYLFFYQDLLLIYFFWGTTHWTLGWLFFMTLSNTSSSSRNDALGAFETTLVFVFEEPV